MDPKVLCKLSENLCCDPGEEAKETGPSSREGVEEAPFLTSSWVGGGERRLSNVIRKKLLFFPHLLWF